MKSSNRREFLRTAAIGGVGAGSILSGIVPGKIYASGGVTYRMLGSTNLKVSEVGFGAMNTRDRELVRAAYDSGINYFDTAHNYMRGENERIVGSALKDVRDKVIISTKISRNNFSTMRSMMEMSLKRLGTDYADVILFHMATADDVRSSEAQNLFDRAKKDGLCRFVGISTHTDMASVISAVTRAKFWDIILTSYNYQSTPQLRNAIAEARKAGIGIVAMKTQVKGAGYTNHNLGSVTPQQAALKWVLQDKNVDTTVPGMTNFEQLREDVAVMGTPLASRDRIELENHRMLIAGDYCLGVAGCTDCQGQCPRGVDVCEINRCLGYATGYGDIELAKANYSELDPAKRADVCGDCAECMVRCPHGLDLTNNIKKARNLLA